MTDDEFLEAFEAQRISHEDWTHEAHIRMAWLYARREPTCESQLEKIRTGIQRLNGVNSVEPSLYHETVTCAFAQIIRDRAMAVDAPENWPEFRDDNRDLIDPGPSPILKHYREETIQSDAARVGFVPPDLEALPGNVANSTPVPKSIR